MYSKIIAANWKMHKTFQEGLQLATEIACYLNKYPLTHTRIVLFPAFIHLEAISKLLSPTLELYVGAQNCHEQITGAFTGEVSATMLASVGVRYVLVGHSERRKNFAESNDLIAKKIDAILSCKLQPVFCCGETSAIRENGQYYAFIKQQLAESLFHLTQYQMEQLIIAYEPMWAIGTGITPSPLEIENMQGEIRNILAIKYNSTLANKAIILYGGSCNAENVSRFINIAGINGVLIGGASLHIKEFLNTLISLKIS